MKDLTLNQKNLISSAKKKHDLFYAKLSILALAELKSLLAKYAAFC